MLTGVHHTSLTVSNLEHSLTFYTTLGLKVVMRQESGAQYLKDITGFPDAYIKMAHLALPGGGGHRLELFEYVSPQGQPVCPRTCDPGSTHLCLLVDDLAATYELLAGQGVAFVSGPITVNAGVNTGGRGLYLRDPDGFTIELFQSPHRS